jgi:hypothetical protein
MRITKYFLGALLVIGMHSNSGESSSPALATAELPGEVLRECATDIATCGETDFDIKWIARLPRGHLFLVKRLRCESGDCAGWLVAKDERGATQVMLSVAGEVRLEYGGGNFPTVRTRAELSDQYTSYARYDWADGQYTRTETRLMYRIDGFECASEEDCHAAAKRALQDKQPGRALRIWQQVHGVNWI